MDAEILPLERVDIGALTLEVYPDYDALSLAGARRVAAKFRQDPRTAVVVATGNTPMGLYRALAKQYRQAAFDSSQLSVFQLDAYLGLSADDPRSLNRWTQTSFVEPLGIAERQVTKLPGDAPDPTEVCRSYDAAVARAGGFGLAVLGLGPNGHLGFNEPPSRGTDVTRVVDLTEASLESNARYWGEREQVPKRAITAGMSVILGAEEILLLVSGAHKREILHQTLHGPVSPDVPASYLQTAKNVTVLVDRAAWSGRD